MVVGRNLVPDMETVPACNKGNHWQNFPILLRFWTKVNDMLEETKKMSKPTDTEVAHITKTK